MPNCVPARPATRLPPPPPAYEPSPPPTAHQPCAASAAASAPQALFDEALQGHPPADAASQLPASQQPDEAAAVPLPTWDGWAHMALALGLPKRDHVSCSYVMLYVSALRRHVRAAGQGGAVAPSPMLDMLEGELWPTGPPVREEEVATRPRWQSGVGVVGVVGWPC